MKALVVAALVALGSSTAATAQAPSLDEIVRYRRVHAELEALSGRLWPGFAPETIPVAFVLPDRGTLLVGWSGEPPAGFSALPAAAGLLWRDQAAMGAASTAARIGDRAVAQVVSRDTMLAVLTGLAAHEAFHVHQRARVRPGSRFGRGENSYYVAQYPIHDEENEASFALELLLLGDALRARSDREARDRVRQFAAVRNRRHRTLDPNVAEFEAMTELNEGLAEYVLMRAESAISGADPAIVTAERLRRLPEAIEQSIRLRFYATGAAQALLLDRLGPADWKTRLETSNATLQELLTEAVGLRAEEQRLASSARGRHGGDEELTTAARDRIARLQRILRARADSLLARPGLTLVLDAADYGGTFGHCGIDPQNLLQLGGGALLHTRWLRLCSPGVQAELETAILEENGRARAVIGAPGAVTITAGGRALTPGATAQTVEQLRITSPHIQATIARARVRLEDGRLIVRPVRP